jgi:hypothetical protein
VTILKPDFAIAYHESGVMWLAFLNYLQNEKHKNCEGDLSATRRDVGQKSEHDLKMALRYDINFADTWLQLSILAYQEAQVETDPASKTALFGLAIERNIRAVDFASTDFYPVRRLFDAIKGLSDWQEDLEFQHEIIKVQGSGKLADDAEEYRLAGIKAFCRAFPGRSWTGRDRQYLTNEKLCDASMSK